MAPGFFDPALHYLMDYWTTPKPGTAAHCESLNATYERPSEISPIFLLALQLQHNNTGR